MTLFWRVRASSVARMVMNIIIVYNTWMAYSFRQAMVQHFAQLNTYLAQQSNAIQRQTALSNQVANEQYQMIKILVQRSEESFAKLVIVIQKLCAVLDHYEQDQEIAYANQQVQAEIAQWGQLQNKINLRKQLLHIKVGKGQKSIKSYTKSKNYDCQVLNQAPTLKKGDYSVAKSLKPTNEVSVHDNYKMKLRDQFFTIKQFIVGHLSQMIEYAEASEIPKKIVLNIYMRWNRLNGRICQIDETGKIQMELTNQLKHRFPKIILTRKVFKGVQFKVGFAEHLELTDRAPPFREEDVSFNGEDYFGPIDDLLREAEENGGSSNSLEKEELQFGKDYGLQ